MKKSIIMAQEYWNKDKIVNEFASAKAPEYWQNFFKEIDSPENMIVLDLGCGGGRNTYMLAQLGFKVEACDLHEKMLQSTKKKIFELDEVKRNNVHIQQANMLMLPFKNESIDIVLSNGVYHNTSSKNDFNDAIKETSRVLKQNGLLCVNVFTDYFIDESLKKQEQEFLYITPDHLDMILLSEKVILKIFEEFSLYPYKEIVSYCSQINIGVRSVLRGVFIKK